MKNYDLIIFDLDGTLVDSKPGIFHCIKYALDQKGIYCPDEVMGKMIGPPFRVSMKEFLGLEMPVIEELITLYRGLYEVSGFKESRVYDGVFEMLAALRKGGKKLAIATSKPMKFTSMMVEELGLNKYFDFVGGASTDLSREDKKDIIALVLDSMGTQNGDALMVGDRLYDIVGARAKAVDVAGVLWGYGSKEEMDEYAPDYLFDTPARLVEAVLNGVK